ncbi:ral GTPase-activating protein subunit alpha-1 isoform X2 [Planococcus citri]|uniref:ral GTPase-activating protein subunit alpha-1 isoform X2 n=1 Tax=Planococcus citri TaxID=170843 RepID=UPI0031F90ABB
MFGKKVHGDIKKSAQKINDLKKDSATRYKHLKNVLEHIDGYEAKAFFELNYSSIYHIFYDNFVTVESNLKQKVHKAHKEELDNVLYVLEKILILCPELIANRWQCHSLTRILTKLLHPGNSWKLRREAIKYFILWYQVLGENAPECAHALYTTLVPGFSSPIQGYGGLEHLGRSAGSVFQESKFDFNKRSKYENSRYNRAFFFADPVSPAEILPVYPPPSGEKPPEDAMKFFLESLLDCMVTQVPRIKWNDLWNDRRNKCFTFLFEKFKKYYLPVIFRDYSDKTNIYDPVLELPGLRYSVKTDKYLNCRVSVIRWVASFAHDVKHKITATPTSGPPPPVTKHPPMLHQDSGEQSPIPYLKNANTGVEDANNQNTEDTSYIWYQIVRDVLFGSRENVNFVHEIFRQAFLLPFSCSPAIRRTIAVHKDWIQMNVIELPVFMLEPVERPEHNSLELCVPVENEDKPLRLRNDSYVGAITKENYFVRAGLQNTLQLFITHAANVFLLETTNEIPVLLEEQVDICKRVLNMYRYMVMHTHMELKTWEQLLLILLQITSTMLGRNPPKKKDEKLGGRLAPAIFQTLIVTWIKANLNVVISFELWNQFCEVLSSLTQWEELIREWAKTMETLTRVLARHVYNLDLQDLPLDRLTEQKAKRRKGFIGGGSKKTSSNENSMKPEESNTCQTINETEPIDVSDERIVELDNKPLPISSMKRSKSDSNVSYEQKPCRKREYSESGNCDTNFETISLTNDTKEELPKPIERRKWRSLDSLRGRKRDCASEQHSRSASPAPSSGIENNSIKDAPIQIDVVAHDQSQLDHDQDEKSVIAGGNIRGWLPDVAIVLWKRMLGALGNVNEISDPTLHAQVFHHLIEFSHTLIKMKNNQGVPEDNQKTPLAPEYIPPLTIFAPWCFQAFQLTTEYQRGKLCAYKLLCQITMAAPNSCLSKLHISKFYTVLHNGLNSSDKNIVYTIMKHTGPKFFSRQLPGYSLLVPDFIKAAELVLTSDDLGLTPRPEAASVLATLLSLSKIVAEFPSFKNTANIAEDLKVRALKILIHAAKKEQSGLARCIALSALGVYLIEEFETKSKHSYIKEAFNTLLLAIKFNHEVVAQVACDVLCLICDYVDTILEQFPELACKTIEVLANALCSMMPIEDGKKRLLTSLVFCMAEWTMRLPLNVLLQPYSEQNDLDCLLFAVFKVLEELSNGGRQKCSGIGGHFSTETVKEFDANITLDNLKHDEYEQRSFSNIMAAPSHLNSTRHSLQLAAKMVSAHLISNLGQFPIIPGAARLSSLVTEQDDNMNLTNDQLSMEIFSLSNLQMFVATNNMILSLLELPALEVPGGGVTADLITASSQVRILLRSLNGKFCWDASVLFCTPEQLAAVEEEDERWLLKSCPKKKQLEDARFTSYIPTSPPQHMIRHRPPHVLPTVENSAGDLDNLDDLLQYIGYTSPECLEDPEIPRNVPSVCSPLSPELEQETISAILSEKCLESDYLLKATNLSPPLECRPKHKDIPSSFQYSRLLLSQLGFLGWDMRSRLYLLQRTEKVLRELRNLDSQFCRETHKIAVIYVANGQEDKVSILSNTGGSQKYEDFIAALAWEVELESHTGFMGGLQRNRTTGVTAPYYATSFSELILHVSTRMSSSTPEALINKTRHLGNDEVHIVWSEHSRDYRRGILPTEFCDILIVIYPLPHDLYRIQISKKPEVPYFGLCLNEVIVGSRILPSLIRSIAVSASRAKRSMLPFHQQHYEERFRSLETIVRNHKMSSTYEDFAANIYAPGSANICYPTNPQSKTTAPGDSSSSNGNVWLAGDHAVVDVDSSVVGISPRPFKKLTSKSSARRSMIVTPTLTPPDSPTLRKSK